MKNIVIIGLVIIVYLTLIILLLISDIQQMLGAFAGAFFAFTFAIIYSHLDEAFKRRKKHYNILVSLEQRYQFLLSEIGTNCFITESIIKDLSKQLDPRQIGITYNQLHKITVDKTVIDELLNIDLKNDLLDHFILLDRLNGDIELLNFFYQEIKQALINKHITREEYESNVIVYIARLKELTKFLSDLTQRTKIIAVKVRILLLDKVSFWQYSQRYTINAKYSDALKENIQDELKKLNSEIEEINKRALNVE